MNGECITVQQKVLSRHEKEMAIQISEMEKYKYICSEQCGTDVGKTAYFEWAQKYGCKVRNWLESLNDDEVNNIFETISEHIKHCIVTKTH